MPEPCCVCGDPVFVHVDERGFCQKCGAEVLWAIELTVDYLRRDLQTVRVPSRFTTIGEVIVTKQPKREGR